MKTFLSKLRRPTDAPADPAPDAEEDQEEQAVQEQHDADKWDANSVENMNYRWERQILSTSYGAATAPQSVCMSGGGPPLGAGVLRSGAAAALGMPGRAMAKASGMPRMAMAACAGPPPMPCAAPAAAMCEGAAFGGAIGFKTGGAQDAANFRENIAAGHLPSPSDVSYEGLIKEYYFDTSSPDAPPCTELFCPTYSLALAPDPLLGAPALEPAGVNPQQAQQAQQQEVFLAVGLDSGITDFRRPRLNLVVLLDISGSMACPFDAYYYDGTTGQRRQLGVEESRRTKMDVAKEVIKGMLGKLTPEDSVAICLFNNAAASPKRLGRWGTADAAGIRAGIDALYANGGTNFQAGLDEATQQLRGYADCIDGDAATTENRIIVLTDAETNCGDVSETGLLVRLKANAADRFYTTVVGVGLDFNSELVSSIMKVKGANYFSVHSPGEFKQRLEDEFDFMVAPLVFDLELRVDPASLAAPAQQGASPAAPAQQVDSPALPEGERQEGQVEWEVVEGEEAVGGGRHAGGGQPPAAEQAQQEGSGGVAAGGWKVLHVYGSPDSEERRLSGGGSIMRVNTLFPSAKTEEGIKGGVVLLRMQPPPGTTAATAPPLRLAARYCDRSGRQYNTLRTVEVPAAAAAASAAAASAAAGKGEGEGDALAFFQSSGVRKAVALARLVDALKCWLVDEWAGPQAPANSNDAWQASEVVTLQGGPAPPSRPIAPATPPAAPAGPRLLRPGCPLLPPDDQACMQVQPALGRWERQSRALSVNPDAKAALGQLLPFMEREVAALEDEEMHQEVELLRKLVGR